MFVDASAIVAILTREPDADALADLLDAAPSPITSPIAIFEAVLGICRKRHASVEEAEQDVRDFLDAASIRPVSTRRGRRKRRSRRSPAMAAGGGIQRSSNLGDCFAYAMAKNNRTSLLFKGDDFDKTDILSAAAGAH